MALQNGRNARSPDSTYLYRLSIIRKIALVINYIVKSRRTTRRDKIYVFFVVKVKLLTAKEFLLGLKQMAIGGCQVRAVWWVSKTSQPYRIGRFTWRRQLPCDPSPNGSLLISVILQKEILSQFVTLPELTI